MRCRVIRAKRLQLVWEPLVLGHFSLHAHDSTQMLRVLLCVQVELRIIYAATPIEQSLRKGVIFPFNAFVLALSLLKVKASWL